MRFKKKLNFANYIICISNTLHTTEYCAKQIDTNLCTNFVAKFILQLNSIFISKKIKFSHSTHIVGKTHTKKKLYYLLI